MMKLIILNISCADRVGLISALTSRLFDLGANLADTSFAVLGESATFSAVCEIPSDLSTDSIQSELSSLPDLIEASIDVKPFEMTPTPAANANITHRISIDGGDQPGLIARLSEVFIQFGANIVRLNTQTTSDNGNSHYRVNIAVSIPENTANTCLATVANTAGELGLNARSTEVNR